jgi:hypothetical protein
MASIPAVPPKRIVPKKRAAPRPPANDTGMMIVRDTSKVAQPTPAEIEQMKIAEKRRRRDVI